jgi:hypothetical protein
VRRITEHAAGIPRVINMVCDHCLLIGYGEQTRLIDLDIIQRAIKYLAQGEAPVQTQRRTGPRLQWQRPLKWSLGVVAAGAVAAIAALAVHAGSVSSVLSDVHAWWLR